MGMLILKVFMYYKVSKQYAKMCKGIAVFFVVVATFWLPPDWQLFRMHRICISMADLLYHSQSFCSYAKLTNFGGKPQNRYSDTASHENRIMQTRSLFAKGYCLNPMRRQFGDRKISQRTECPEGDFVGPQTHFAQDLHS